MARGGDVFSSNVDDENLEEAREEKRKLKEAFNTKKVVVNSEKKDTSEDE